MAKGHFFIKVKYDDEMIEVDKVDIVGGFKMPSLEMTDLLGDVISELEDKRLGCFNGYITKVKKVNKEGRSK